MSREEPENGCKLPIVPAGMAVRNAIARRVSCRAYQPKPVPQAQLMQILEAGAINRFNPQGDQTGSEVGKTGAMHSSLAEQSVRYAPSLPALLAAGLTGSLPFSARN